MSWSDANDPGWEELDDSGELEPARWPLAPTGVLLPREKWLWFQQLWTDVCSLRDRYRGDLPIRSGWWRTSSTSRRSPRSPHGSTATTAENGTTPRASSRSCTRSSAWPHYCMTAASHFSLTATGLRSRAT